jgi:hypothetical protein
MSTSCLEHRPHEGTRYKTALGNKRLLIVGHSHHKKPDEEDRAEFTVECVEWARERKMQRFPFFARQPRYLNLTHEQYYDTIALINYPPNALSHRHASPTGEQIAQAKIRFGSILVQLEPTHVIVLTPRYLCGRELPATDEQRAGKPVRTLEIDDQSYEWGHITSGSVTAVCCKLRHPQGARTATMQKAFAAVLALT